MKTLFKNKLTRPVMAIALAMAGLVAGGAAHSAGTGAGTAITNLATLNYSVGGAPQTAIGSSAAGNTTGAGTATSFVVDNKINLLVATTDTTFVSVVPGLTGVAGANPNGASQVTTFTVTNSGNSTQDFSLAAASLASGTTLFGGTDNFDGTACVARVESGTTAGYDATDTAIFLDEVPADGVRTVYVICAIPVARVNNDVAVVSLTATALVGGTAGQGAALVESTGVNTAGVDIVFADGAGTDDAARNANFSARSAFRVVSATLTVTKSVAAVCDPFNGSTNPKNIPGTFVRYTITIANTGAASATLSTVGDTLTSLVTFDANLITGIGGPGTAAATCSVAGGAPTSAVGSGFLVPPLVGGTRAGFPKYFTTTSSVDGVDLVGTNVNVNFGLVLPVEAGYTAGELKATESVSVIFQVLIN